MSRTHPATIACVALALVFAGCWTYATSFNGVFVGDDIETIVANPNIKSLWPLTRPLSAPPDTGVAGRPVASLTFALNYALSPSDVRDVVTPGGQAPPGSPADPFYANVWGYHACNLTVHLAAGLLLLGVARLTLASPPLRARFGSAAVPLAFAISLLWLVHPLQTASVTYIVQRIESLMGLFFLLTLYSAIRALEASRTDTRRAWMAASITACALGMGTKETMVGAPIVVALWIWLFRPREEVSSRTVRPLLIGLAATWIVLALLLMTPTRSHSAGFGLEGWPWWFYLRTQAAVIGHYLRLSVVPSPLVFLYGWLPATSWASVLPQTMLLVALAVLTGVGVVRRQPAALIGGWFFVVLAPTSSIFPIPTEVAAEHRMYLPLASVVAVVVLGAYALSQNLVQMYGGERPTTRNVARAVAWLGLAAVAAMLATAARARNVDYWSTKVLLADSVRKRPDSASARIGYGVELLEEQQFAEAESQLRAALDVPKPPGSDVRLTAGAHMYLGSALCAQNKLQEGISHLEQALALNPKLSEAHGFLAEAYVSLGRYARAAASFEQALAGLPDLPPLLHRVAWFYATTPDAAVRNGAKAVELAERAVRLTAGRNWMMLDVLGVAYAEQGRFADAVSSVQRALALAQSGPGAGAVPELQQHLARFQSNRPLRSP